MNKTKLEKKKSYRHLQSNHLRNKLFAFQTFKRIINLIFEKVILFAFKRRINKC